MILAASVRPAQAASTPIINVATFRIELLPDPFETAAIIGGFFELRALWFNNGNNTFPVDAVLLLTSGGSGTVTYHGLLDHNTFPPTIAGTLSR